METPEPYERQLTSEEVQRRVKESLERRERALAKRRKWEQQKWGVRARSVGAHRQARRRLGKDRSAAKVPPEKRVAASRAKAKKAKRARRANRR